MKILFIFLVVFSVSAWGGEFDPWGSYYRGQREDRGLEEQRRQTEILLEIQRQQEFERAQRESYRPPAPYQQTCWYDSVMRREVCR